MHNIDLNCDMGESWNNQIVGQDAALMPHITSCNLACGEHGGDPDTMRRAVELAAEHGVNIGAHPSLPDRHNFGREPVDLPEPVLRGLIFDQVERLQTVANAAGQTLHHLKPHGALYHLAAQADKEAEVVVAAALKFRVGIIFGPPNSLLAAKTKEAGLTFWREGFVDRAYENGHQLRSRKKAGAVHELPAVAAQQAYDLVVHQQITDYYGQVHPLTIDTLCVHGDHRGALELLLAVQAKLGGLLL